MSKWVLDASALLCLLNREAGGDTVLQTLSEGAAMSTVNLSEVVAKLADAGMPEAEVRDVLGSLPLEVKDFDEELSFVSGFLRPRTRGQGLSLGDRACLALAMRLGAPAVTADGTWKSLALGVDIVVVR